MERYLNKDNSGNRITKHIQKKINPNLKIDDFKNHLINCLKEFNPLNKPNNYIEYTLKLMWFDYITKNLVDNKKEDTILNLKNSSNM